MSVEGAYRVGLGAVVLLLVDFIWTASSELTEYVFKKESYGKPFFVTYIKTSMFMIYLVGFVVWKPWREQCCLWLESCWRPSDQPLYSALQQNETEGETEVDVDQDPEDGEGPSCSINCNPKEQTLSESIWVPIKAHGSDLSGNTSESEGDTKSHLKMKVKVRFSKLTEVRHLSDSQANDALLARLSYAASLRAEADALRAANRLSIQETAKLALIFCFFLFCGSFTYQLALFYSEAGFVSTLSSTSTLFTLLLTSVFPSNSTTDRFTVTKLLASIMAVASVAVISTSSGGDLETNLTRPGVLWALTSAFFYACYVVILRHKVVHEDNLEIPMFFGFVGLFNFIFVWPGFFILNYTKIEVFKGPSWEQLSLILVNGLIGTVFSELLWLWGCFLTSSLMATLSVTLTVPLTIGFDVLLQGVKYPPLFFWGSIPLVASFILVTCLSSCDWDPIAFILQRLVRQTFWRRPPNTMDSTHIESLLNENA